ncbi:MAG: hypothetical protein VKN33_01510 [Candidatus Sericytochromatia bacterium]|nr:hypothetical protein [Candidatus Sericytochromatia bacterium]
MPPHTDEHPISEAIRNFLAQEGVENDLDVQTQAVEGLFARVLVTDTTRELTPIFGFLKKSAGAWTVLAAGTDFEPEFFRAHQVPPGLHL